MPAAYPEEFRRRAVSLVVDEGVPAARVAKDLGIAESGLRRWVDRHLVEAGRKPGVTGDERDELVRLRRENRVLRVVLPVVMAERTDGTWTTLLDVDALRACDGDVDAFAARLATAMEAPA